MKTQTIEYHRGRSRMGIGVFSNPLFFIFSLLVFIDETVHDLNLKKVAVGMMVVSAFLFFFSLYGD